MTSEHIRLISRWPLKNGMSDELEAALVALADAVRADEPGTLSYEAFVDAAAIDPAVANEVIDGRLPDAQQPAVTFVETYEDRAAFDRHLDGPGFTRFRASFVHHFDEDPERAGWPAATVTFLSQIAATHR